MDDEAMEKNLISVTPTNIVPNGGFNQNSADSFNIGSSSPLSLRSDERVQSRYLSPHMASCHDFCKYGKKYDSDAHTKHLNFKKFLKAAQKREQEKWTSSSVGERGTGRTSKPKVEPNLETELSSKSETPKMKQTPPFVKDSFAYSEKKRIQTSLASEEKKPSSGERRIRTERRPKATAKKETEFLDKTEAPKMQVQTGKQDQVTSVSPRGTRIRPVTQPKSMSKLGTKLSNKIDVPRLQVEDKHIISQNPREQRASTVKIAKGTVKVETEYSDEAELPKLQSPPSTKDPIPSGGKSMVQISIYDEHSKVKSLIPVVDQKKEKLNKREVMDPRSKLYYQPNAIIVKAPSDTDVSGELNIVKQQTESPVKDPTSSGTPKVIDRETPLPLAEFSKIKKKVSLHHKRFDGAGKPAVILKTKTPLIRSISLLKSSRSFSRMNHENRTTRGLGASEIGLRKVLNPSSASLPSESPGDLFARRNQESTRVKSLTTSEVGERKLLKPIPAPSSKTAGDVSSNLQLRKLRSVKKTSTPQDSVSSTPLRELWSATLKQTPLLKSDKAPSLQLRKLRSIKRTSIPDDNVLNLQPRKLRNVKQSSVSQNSVSTLQPRVSLRKVNRSLFRKERDNTENIESKSENINLDPNQKNEEDTESESSGVRREGTEENEEIEVSTEEDGKKRFGRSATAQKEDNNTSTPFKLKFRRGKVIYFRTDSMGARRLWFNIGKLANERTNSHAMLWRRSFKKKMDIDHSDIDAPNPEVQSVVLKHQGIAEKKDAQSLFNYVIEETASKLVETRKSKVKALVGAFETVISLQESRPASTV